MKSIVIRYVVRPDVDLDVLRRDIGEFVAGLGAHPSVVNYRSFEIPEEPRRFMHVGEFQEDGVADLQKQPFFEKFTKSLRERCVEPPTVTAIRRVAATPA